MYVPMYISTLSLGACVFVRCACAGSCGGHNDHRVKGAEHNLGQAEASGDQSAIKKAATAVAAAKVACQKTSGLKRDAGRLATHMWVCMYVGTYVCR